MRLRRDEPKKWPKKQTADLTAEQRQLALRLPAKTSRSIYLHTPEKRRQNWHDKSPWKKCGCQQKSPLKKCGCPQKYRAPLERLDSLESRNSRTHRARRPDIGIRAFSAFCLIFSAARKVVRANYLHFCFMCGILYMCLKATRILSCLRRPPENHNFGKVQLVSLITNVGIGLRL